MITIYHNPRCSKSREGLGFLEDEKIEHKVVKYLDKEFTTEELAEIIKILDIKPIDLVRKNEQIWKENYKNQEFTDAEIIEILINNPKLIERPIVINGNRGVIARPFSKINDII